MHYDCLKKDRYDFKEQLESREIVVTGSSPNILSILLSLRRIASQENIPGETGVFDDLLLEFLKTCTRIIELKNPVACANALSAATQLLVSSSAEKKVLFDPIIAKLSELLKECGDIDIYVID